ncbi:MAG: hypothetical protein IPL99_27870 [Candidatus Competibacteraceae bacterium]|nr:hypothetical protein [Candidatus Competibacteraceae bacterium]
MIDNILFLNRIYTPAIPKEPEKWFNYLKNEEIDFIIRIKKNAKTTNSQGQEVPVQNLFLHLKLAEQLTLEDSRLITGVKVYLTALRLKTVNC